MQNLILTPISVPELVNLIANEVEYRINRADCKDTPPDRIGISGACEITGFSKSQVYKLTMNGEIPFEKFGKRLVFSRKELLSWMKSRTISPDSISDTITENLAKSAKKHLKKC